VSVSEFFRIHHLQKQVFFFLLLSLSLFHTLVTICLALCQGFSQKEVQYEQEEEEEEAVDDVAVLMIWIEIFSLRG